MVKTPRILLFLFIAGPAVLIGSCKRDQSTSNALQPTTPTSLPATTSPSTQLSADAPNPTTDESMLEKDYVALGIPPYDRPWDAKDMDVAASKLQLIGAADLDQLPRLNSNRSGLVFARIVSRENLNYLRSHSQPVTFRLTQANAYGESLNKILRAYLPTQATEKPDSDEVIELLGAELRITQVELELVDEFASAIPKDDAKYSVRMKGLAKARMGITEMLWGTVTALTDEKVFSIPARSRLLMYCRETFPSIMPRLTAISQHQIIRRLADIADDPEFNNLNPQLSSLVDEVRAAAKTHAEP
jgi:hypothetical protein